MQNKSVKLRKPIIITVSIIVALLIIICATVGVLFLLKDKTPEEQPASSSSSQTSSSSPTESATEEITRVEKILNTYTLPDEYTTPEFKKLYFKDDISNKNVPYSLFLPENYSSKQKYPVIFFLHGAGERGSDHTTALRTLGTLFSYNSDIVKNAIIVAPQCPLDGWWNLDDGGTEKGWLAAAMRLLYDVEDTYSCDKDRIYVMGLSMGGYATWSVLQRYGEHFAAGVPICGWGDPYEAPKMTNIPIWIFHGKLDKTVSIQQSETMYQAITSAGGKKIKFTRLPKTEHSAWTDAFSNRELICWMFAQNKSKNPDATYNVTPYIRVVDANGNVIISELDATRLDLENGTNLTKKFKLVLSSSGVEKLTNAYTKSGGKPFTVYFGNKKLFDFSATEKPVDDAFVIDGVFDLANYFHYYHKIRMMIFNK